MQYLKFLLKGKYLAGKASDLTTDRTEIFRFWKILGNFARHFSYLLGEMRFNK